MSIIQFPIKNNEGTLRGQYSRAINDSLDHLHKIGSIDKNTVLVMIGFLSGAIIAFRMTGDDHAADLVTTAASKLKADWRCFRNVTYALMRELDPLL